MTGTNPTLLQLDGNLGRNAGITPWTVFDDLRVSKRIYFGERFSMDLIADMFNIANKVQRGRREPALQQFLRTQDNPPPPTTCASSSSRCKLNW